MKTWKILASIICLLAWLPTHAETIDKIVSVVNDDIITASELNTQLALVKKQLASKQLALPDEFTLRQQVLDNLIDTELQLQLAKKSGITIDDQELAATIDKLCTHNQMTLAQLKLNLKIQGIPFAQYQENIRKELTLSKLQQSALSQNVVISDTQLNAFIQKHQQDLKAHEQYHLANILIPLADPPSPEAVKQANQKAADLLAQLKTGQAFEKQATDLGWRPFASVPSVFAAHVTKLKVGEVAGPIRADNGIHLVKLIDKRGNQPQHLTTLTQARHILIKLDPLTTPEIAEQKLAKLRDDIINKTSDFAQLAKTHSQDAGSQNQGGDLGWIRPGQSVPAFEQAMNTLKPNEISQPIKSTFGYHLIQVLARKQIDDTADFQKQQVHNRLYQQKFAEAVQYWVRELRDKAHIEIDLG